ncbi:MAG TPA: hypothetical protein VKP78_12745 [bacterium]|nr:hypothetical protein [bacterium]
MGFFKKIDRIWLIFALVPIFFFSCGQKINSHYIDKEVAIDGNTGEWQNKLVYFKNENLSVGVANDDKNIYLCLISSNIDLNRSLFRNGLVTWFDINGKTKERFGIKFPRGMDPAQRKAMQTNRQNQNRPDQRFSRGRDNVMTQFEVLSVDGFRQLNPIHNNTHNISMQLNRQPDHLVYELKIPFKTLNSHSQSLAIKKGDRVGIGFELGDVEQPDGTGQGQKTGGRSGMSMTGSGQMSGSRGSRRGRAQSMSSSYSKLDTWMKVTLSTESTSTKNE